jgi:hypothetical protein
MNKTELAVVDGERKEASKNPFHAIAHKQKRAVLEVYSELGRIGESCKAAGVSRGSHYHWLRRDRKYAAAFEMAKKMALDVFVDEIHRRAFHGYDHPLSYEGKLTGDTVKNYSDNLAMFAVKKLDPEYRDNWVAGAMQGPVSVSFTFAPNSVPAKTVIDAEAEVIRKWDRIDKDDDAGNGEANKS